MLRTIALARIIVWHIFAQTWLTWIAAVPVMFFVAGSFLDPKGQPFHSFLLRRSRRLLLPFWLYGAAIALVSIAYATSRQTDGSPTLTNVLAWLVPMVDPSTGAWTGGWLSSHLWYLRAYLWILVLTPLLRRAANHIGLTLMAVTGGVLLLEAAAAYDVALVSHGTIRVLIGDTLVFGFFATLGIAYHRGHLQRSIRAHLKMASAFGATAVLFAVLIGLPSGGVNSSYPALLLLGLAWLSAIAALEQPMRRMAEHARVAAVSQRVSSRALTIYLWHPACIVVASHFVTGVGFLSSVALLAITGAAIAIAVAVFGWIEPIASQSRDKPRRARPNQITRSVSVTAAIVVAAAMAIVHEPWGVAASARPLNSGSLAPDIPAPSARDALQNSAFALTASIPTIAAIATPATGAAFASAASDEPLQRFASIIIPTDERSGSTLSTAAPKPTAVLTVPPKATRTTLKPSTAAERRVATTPTTAIKKANASKVTTASVVVTVAATKPTTANSSPRATTTPARTPTLTPTPTSAANATTTMLPAAKLQTAFDTWRAQAQPVISSAIVSIRVGDATWTSKSADAGATSRYLPDAAFMASSITKTFTAALVLREVERGALKLDDPVPAVNGLTVAVPTGLTVRRLLTHTSGLVDYRAANGYDATMPLTPLDAVTLSFRTPLFDTTGTTVSYANSNYLYLGLLVEQIEGKPYADLLRELTTSAGLKNTRLDDTPKPGWVGFSSGGVVATADDLARWGQALFTPGRVLGARGVDMLTTVGDSNLGLGTWPACPCSTDAQGVKRYTAIGHQTADGGMFYFPATTMTVVAMFEPIGHDTHGRIVSLTAALTAAMA